MPPLKSAQEFDAIGSTNCKTTDAISLADIIALTGAMNKSLEAFLRRFDVNVSGELKMISDEISSMKSEISQIRSSDPHDHKIPEAGQELDAVIQETEAATHRIMETAEAIMNADINDNDAYRIFVHDQMLDIFEACTFQDITGQRISKVVKTLQSIDKRINELVENTPTGTHDTNINQSKDNEAHLLNGPQLAGNAMDQNEIDALINDANSQDDIDALFD